MNPITGLLFASACWFAIALKPAHNGAAQLVPPVISAKPLSATMKTSSEIPDTSGELRKEVDPPFDAMLIEDCHAGMPYTVLIPPVEASPGKTFHTFS